jgi:hypothetical protein
MPIFEWYLIIARGGGHGGLPTRRLDPPMNTPDILSRTFSREPLSYSSMINRQKPFRRDRRGRSCSISTTWCQRTDCLCFYRSARREADAISAHKVIGANNSHSQLRLRRISCGRRGSTAFRPISRPRLSDHRFLAGLFERGKNVIALHLLRLAR